MADRPATIFALSTPPGRAALAVVRLSGPKAGAALRAVSGTLPPPRRARLARLRDPATGELLDQAIVLFFQAPKSSTGEDMAELHCHGGRAVVSGVLSALGSLEGVRPAEPGEFTRRAFEAGKLDLTAVEGLADVLAAETAAQRRQALRQLEGGLARRIEDWRARLIRVMAMAEAEIDFSDEDVPAGLFETTRSEIEGLKAEMTAALQEAGRGERVRGGFQVALVGAPNAGKSTLLNALARREVAIVSDEPGTTRDILEVHLDLAGWPVTVADMAGLRAAPGAVEAIGVARARARAETADLRLILLPVDAEPVGSSDAVAFFREGDLVVRTKSDLGAAGPGPSPAVSVSAATGAGLDALLREIESRAALALAFDEAPAMTRERHREALQDAVAALDRLLGIWDETPDIRAEELRLAARALGRITGRVDVEDILDVVFASFCIGK